jgi:hypothetical protein
VRPHSPRPGCERRIMRTPAPGPARAGSARREIAHGSAGVSRQRTLTGKDAGGGAE